MTDVIQTLETAINEAVTAVAGNAEAQGEGLVLRDLALRTRKLRRAWARRQSVGLFGPSQAGKSFLVGALLSHELGSLKVMARDREVDFLKEINPAKGVESTGTVTRFTASALRHRRCARATSTASSSRSRACSQSMATGFLVECTSPPLDVDRVERTLREARLQAGPPAPPDLRARVGDRLARPHEEVPGPAPVPERAAPSPGAAQRRPRRPTSRPPPAGSSSSRSSGAAPATRRTSTRSCARSSQGTEQLGHAEAVEVALAARARVERRAERHRRLVPQRARHARARS